MPKSILTLPATDYLHQCFHYDPEKGELRWRERPREHFTSSRIHALWNKRWAGKPVGSPTPKGYLHTSLDSRKVYVSRIIYKLHYGEDPEWMDHKDGNRTNNRAENLRSVSMLQNNRNMLKRPGKSGYIGAAPRRGLVHGKPFRASIRGPDGKRRYLGVFDTAEKAHAAYVAAANEIFGEHSPFKRIYSTAP